MSKCKVFFTSMAVVVLLSGVLQASLVSFSTDAVSSWSPSGAVILQGISAPGPANLTMTAETHSTFTVIITAVNDTGFVWTGYSLDLDPAGNATFVDGTAGSTVFDNVAYTPYTLTFSAPDDVPIGGAVGLQFDLDIPDTGPHTFTLTQIPIPEPATVALLGLGALALVARRKS
ncbi:MAG: PEP-CTERM sorting domain-containing protein [Planctomycetes bacterium]|nr:PEP-CTERM sorting domain-containing protein [Planctomycetota bacterium]